MNPFKWLLKVYPWIFVACIIAIAVWALMAMEYEAQDDVVYPFACFPELGMSDIEAREIWVPYGDYGVWDFMLDDDAVIIRDYSLRPIRFDDGSEIWRRYRQDTDEYYIWIFRADDLIPDEDGGVHSCGQGAIGYDDYLRVTDG